MALGKWYWKVSCDRNLNLFCSDDSLIVGTVSATAPRASNGINGITVLQNPGGIAVMIRCPVQAGTLAVYDVSGRSIAAPGIAVKNGYGVAKWGFTDKQGRTVPAGVYVMRISTGGRVDVRRVLKK